MVLFFVRAIRSALLSTFYQDTYHYRNPELLRAHQFRAEHFVYDLDRDTFVCPAEKPLHFQYVSRYTTDNGYASDRRNYECLDCAACPLKSQCAPTKGNCKSRISFRLALIKRLKIYEG
jgi:hypothetical protein